MKTSYAPPPPTTQSVSDCTPFTIFFPVPQLCGADKPYLSPEKLKDKHEEIKKTSLEEFRSKRKMGSSQISQTYEDELIRKIEEAYESFVKRNESKHILYAYRTPAVLSTIMVLSYLISTILDTLGIESLSQTAIFGLYIPLLLTLVWLYVKYSGDFREVGQFIDNVTSAIWDQVSIFWSIPPHMHILKITMCDAGIEIYSIHVFGCCIMHA